MLQLKSVIQDARGNSSRIQGRPTSARTLTRGLGPGGWCRVGEGIPPSSNGRVHKLWIPSRFKFHFWFPFVGVTTCDFTFGSLSFVICRMDNKVTSRDC